MQRKDGLIQAENEGIVGVGAGCQGDGPEYSKQDGEAGRQGISSAEVEPLWCQSNLPFVRLSGVQWDKRQQCGWFKKHSTAQYWKKNKRQENPGEHHESNG